ncbi:hypothetical protein [Staphylococcus agnetis]|uniref:hypothetical protein n=1 Tax=Staphylococcus agnetis TaxID=985762 RepID=UPI001187B232|nr:hypothetical protein [Staphylococcus agnetis]QDW98050.1 hypothetical protein DWB91_02235 [Staphylococcus agnetis]UXU59995.1 hypothetical protein MUA97_02280 [Staphylococcus agnetis]UXU62327.1 hypothetical protein MUA43_02280 [Staphylococcus agnetis]
MTNWEKDLKALLQNQSVEDRAQLETMLNSMLEQESPNQFIQLLGNPTVDALKQLCREHHIKGYSALKKDEIATLLITSIVTQSYFNEVINQMNEDQQRLFLHILAMNQNGESIETDISFPESFLIFETERDERGYHLLWIPEEIIAQVEKWVTQHETLKQFKLEQDVIEATTNLYGLYSLSQLQHVMNKYLEKTYSLLEIRKLLRRFTRLMPHTRNFIVGEGYITSVGLELEPDEYHHFLKDAKYYEPATLNDLLYYQTHVFGLDDETYFNFVSWLSKNIREDNKLNATVDGLTVEILTMMKHAIEYNMVADVMYSLVQDGILRKRVEQTAVNKVKPVYMKMRNWIYHGHTFEEYMHIIDREERNKHSNVIDFNDIKQ